MQPENILVDLSGPNPILKVVDFGASVHYQLSQEISPPASLEFAAPECVLGQPAGPPCDVWGAAVYLYIFLRCDIIMCLYLGCLISSDSNCTMNIIFMIFAFCSNLVLYFLFLFVVCYISGLSPFLDESIEETTSNVLKCDFSFPDEFFGSISVEAKMLVSKILIAQPNLRISAHTAMSFPWFQMVCLTHSNCDGKCILSQLGQL